MKKVDCVQQQAKCSRIGALEGKYIQIGEPKLKVYKEAGFAIAELQAVLTGL